MSGFTKNINTAANSDFLSAFIRAAAGTNEANSLVTKNGTLSAEGMARIQNALFELAYHDQTLTEQFSEGDESPLRNVIRTMMNVAPVAAQISEGIKAGDFYGVDFAEDIVEAEKFLKDLKQNPKYENETRKAAEHYELYPGTMLGAVPDYLKKLEIAMDENIRSGRNLSYLLNRVLEGVKNMGDPNQTDMFGGMYDLSTEDAVNAQKEKIVGRAIKATEEWKAQRAEEAKRYSSRDAAYMPLAEKYRDGTATITASMTDSERASILKDKFITAADYRGQSNDRIANERENLDSGKVGLVKKALTRAAQEFGLPKSLVNDDTNMTVVVSIGSLKEGAGKQIDNAEQLIKLLPVLDEAVAGAIGIEAHDNRYYADYNTALFVNLLGGYSEGSMFVPVRFGVKVDNLGKATLYVVISDQQINKAEVVKSPTPGKPGENDSRSASGINIPQLAGKINTPDIVKYLPDEFLSNSQKKIKNKAIAETVKYTNDKNDRKYVEYIQNGDWRSAKRMVAEAAKASGYNIRAWHGTTAFFTVFRKGDIGYHVGSMEQAEDRVRGLESARIMPLFVKANNLLEIGMDYGNWGGSNVALMLLETEVFEDDPDIEDKLRKILKIDRAKGKETTSQRQNRALRELLQSLGYDGIVYENAFEGHSKLHSGDNKSYILFDPSQLKSADIVTCDDNGNIVPLSERFNDREVDIRRSSRADSDIALWNPPDVDTRGIYEAVKNGSGKVDGRFDVTVDAGNNGFNVTIKDTQTGETYKDGATVEAGENAEAFAERYTAAIIRNIKSGRPESTSRSTAGIYIEKGENPVRDVNIPVFDVNGDKVRRFMRTVEESGAIPDDMVDDIKKDIMAGGESYKPISNKSALAAFQQNGKRRPRSKLPGVLIRFSAETAPLPSSACRAR